MASTNASTAPAASAVVPTRQVAPRRLLYTTSELTSDGYSQYRREVRHETTDPVEATLVDSLTVAGTHAPAFDLDFPAALIVDTDGQVTVWVDAKLRRGTFRRFLRTASELGLAGPTVPSWRDLGRARRARAYGDAASSARDHTVLTAALRRGANLGRTLEEAIDTAAAVTCEGTLPTTTSAGMADPWPIALRVPAYLLQSSTAGHHHLLVTGELTWPAYKRLLQAATRARLLQRGYAQASIARQGTHLRLPWVTKKN